MQSDDLTDTVYLHFQEAFDPISYENFWWKGKVKKGYSMDTYLKDRTKKAIVNGQFSVHGLLQVSFCRDLYCWK